MELDPILKPYAKQKEKRQIDPKKPGLIYGAVVIYEGERLNLAITRNHLTFSYPHGLKKKQRRFKKKFRYYMGNLTKVELKGAELHFSWFGAGQEITSMVLTPYAHSKSVP